MKKKTQKCLTGLLLLLLLSLPLALVALSQNGFSHPAPPKRSYPHSAARLYLARADQERRYPHPDPSERGHPHPVADLPERDYPRPVVEPALLRA